MEFRADPHHALVADPPPTQQPWRSERDFPREVAKLLDVRQLDLQLEKLVRTFAEAAGASGAALIVDEQGPTCRATLAPGGNVQLERRPLAQARCAPSGLIEQVFTTSAPIILADAPGDGTYCHGPFLAEPPARSVMAVPIARAGLVLGVWYFEQRGENAFSSASAELVRQLSTPLGLALENEQLERTLAVVRRERDERDRDLLTFFRGLPGAVWAVDPELEFTHGTGRSLALVGIDRDRLLGTSLCDLLGTHDPNEPAIAHHRAALAGRPQSFDYQMRGRWFSVQLEPLTGDDGKVLGCLGIAFDITDKREAEAQLARSEAQLEEAQRVAHIGSYEWDIEANHLTWSEELKRIYGLEAGGFRGTFEDFLARVQPDEVEATRATILAAYHSLGPFVYDHRIVRPDGEIRVLHTRGEVIKNAEGKPVRMVGTCWDVTELSKATAAQQAAVSLLQATIEATADGILVIDRARRVVAHNQRFLSLWGIPPELAGRGDDEALLKWILDQLEDPDRFLRLVNELYASPESESLDLVRFKDGRVFERYTRPQTVGEEVVGRVWSFRDISERERMLRRITFLAEATRLLVSLEVEQALEAVAHLAVPSLGDSCAFELFGDQTPPRSIAVSRDPERPAAIEVHPSVLGGRPTIYALGATCYLGVPLMIKDHLVGALTLAAPAQRRYTSADLELAEELGRRAALSIENARLYRGARDALRARDEFLSIAAHEIRGPITAIHLAVQSIRKGLISPGLLDLIERQDRRLSRFVEELLDLARLREGRLRLEYETVDLVQVVREVTSRLKAEAVQSGSALSLTGSAQVPGQWDKFRLDQVVTNLVSNAIKFGGGKPIELLVRAEAGVATLVVRDHGIGFDRAVQSRIFEPFVRGVSVRHYGGLGLGLHIVKTLVEALGGAVTAEGEPGGGATFTVQLPQTRAVGDRDADADHR